MARPLDFILEQFPGFKAYSDFDVARELYRRDYGDAQKTFSTEEDFINYLTKDEEEQPQDIDRFGRRITLEEPEEDQGASILGTIPDAFEAGLRGIQATGRGITGGVAGLFGDEQEQQEQLALARQSEALAAQAIEDNITSWRDIGGIGDLARYTIQRFGESSPYLVAGIGGGLAGGAVGGPIGGIIGATAALTPLFFGQNVLRQSEEVREGRKEEINEIYAAASAPVQAALDAVLFRVLGLVGKPLNLLQTPARGIFGKALRGGLTGVPTEAVTEVGQQFIERLQAGLSLDSEDALREYEEAAVAGGLLGGVVGGVSGPLTQPSATTLERELSKVTEEAKKQGTTVAPEVEETLEVEPEETIETTSVDRPTVPPRAEPEALETETVSNLQEQGREDGNRLFIGDMLTKKLQSIIDTQGEQAAKEYYKGYTETAKTRFEPPSFERASREVKKPITAPQIGQKRFAVDKVDTDQFEAGEGFVVRDNRLNGQDSLAFRTQQEADSYIQSQGDPDLTAEDVTIPPKPAEGTTWDSKKGQWVDQFEGQRGKVPAKKVTIKEKRIPINITDLTAKEQRKVDYYRNTKNFRKDREKYPNTDLKEMIDSGVVPADARLVENLTNKQQVLLKNRRKTKKDQFWTTDKELEGLGVVPVNEKAQSVLAKQKEERQSENQNFKVDFEVALKEDGRFQVNKLLRDQDTNNVVQEIPDSVFTDENVAGRRLRDLQEEAGVEPDITAGKPVITLAELKARDRSDKKILSSVTEVIEKEIAKIAGPETGVAFATEKIVAPEGSYGFESNDGTVGNVEGFYDRDNDIVYLSLQRTAELFQAGKLNELVSHESFHALQRTIKNAKKTGVFTKKEQDTLNTAFPEGNVDSLPEYTKQTLGTDVMQMLRDRHRNNVLNTEELQAYVFQAWNAQRTAGKRAPVGNIVQRAFNKIANLFAKTKNFLSGKGFNTYESIFEAAATGEVARRGRTGTREEAAARGEQRATEIQQAVADVPVTRTEEGTVVEPLATRIAASVEQQTNYPGKPVNKTINSSNPIFRPLRFRPSQDAINILNSAAEKIVNVKTTSKPQTREASQKRQRDIQPAFDEINEFRRKLISEKPENVSEGLINEMVQPMVNAAVAIRHGHSFDIVDQNTGAKLKIGEGTKLTGADKKIHDDLSKLRVNNKSLYQAVSEALPDTKEERQVTREQVERTEVDDVAERSARRAEGVLERKRQQGIDREQQIEQQEQEAAARALGIEEETKPRKRKILTLSKEPVQEFFDGGDVNAEADNKTRSETSDDGVKFSVSSLFSSPSDEAIKSLSDTIVEEKAIQNVGGESETGIYKSVFNAYGPRAIDIRTKLQDKLYIVKRIQRKIAETTGQQIPDRLNVYMAEELYWGRTGERLHQNNVKLVEPIKDLLAENKITLEELDLFLYARHAKERNARIFKTYQEAVELRNTRNRTPEQEARFNRIKDYLQNTEEEARAGSGMTDEVADSYMEYYNNRDDSEVFVEMGNLVNKLMQEDLQVKLDGNLISQEQYDEITRGEWENYVPLAGLDYDIDSEKPKMGASGAPIIRTQPRSKIRKTPGFQGKKDPKDFIKGGRAKLDEDQRLARNVFAQAVAKLNNDTIKAEKNKVALTLNEFVKEYGDNPIIANDELFIANPTEEQLASFETDKEAYDKLIKQRFIFKNTKPNPGEKFEFLENGEKRTILLTNEYLARAFNNHGVEAGSKIMQMLGNVTRYLAVINTAYNPEFMLTNAIKDLQTAAINLSDEQTTSFRNNAIKGWRGALKGAFRAIRKPDAEGFWEDAYRDFAAQGGKVGFFTSMKTIDEQFNEIQRDIGNLKSEKAAKTFFGKKGGVRNIIKFITDTNGAVENAIRLSAYQAAVDAGVSKPKAASLAKNLTVNFNRKGEWGGAINSLYLFYNASIQGSFRLFQAIGTSKRVRNLALGIVATSFFLDMFNRAVAGDDDDGRNKYDKINGWIKGHNLILMNPFDTGPGYVSIPLPWGYNWLSIVGQTIASSMPDTMGGARKNELSIGESAARTAVGLVDAFSPVGSGDSIIELASPAVIKPFVQLQRNEDYAGRAIYPPDNPFDGNAGPPNSQTYWDASETSKTIASTLNNLTGGSPVRSGIADFHPDTLDFIAGQMFGGAGAFLGRTFELGRTFLTGKWDEIGLNDIPFVRRVVKKQPSFINKQNYFDIRDEIKIAENLIDYLIQERQFDELRDARQEYRSLLSLSPAIKSLESKRRKFRKQIKKIEDNRLFDDDRKKELIKKIFDREEILLTLFLKRADKILRKD